MVHMYVIKARTNRDFVTFIHTHTRSYFVCFNHTINLRLGEGQG